MDDHERCIILFVNETDRIGHRSVVDHVMRRAMELHIAGATAFRAVEGFGEHLQLRRASLLSLGEDEGIAIVIAERAERLHALLDQLDLDGVHALAVEMPAELRRLGPEGRR